jgi:hypothetical protein
VPPSVSPLRRINIADLRWTSWRHEQDHFTKHSRDAGDCLKQSLGSLALSVAGYTAKAKEVVAVSFRFYFTARIRPHNDKHYGISDWFFSSQLFCVAVCLDKPVIVTAFHHHLHWGPTGHFELQRNLSTDHAKEDEFIAWLDRCTLVSASAKALRGSTASHVITDVTKHFGFPESR